MEGRVQLIQGGAKTFGTVAKQLLLHVLVIVLIIARLIGLVVDQPSWSAVLRIVVLVEIILIVIVQFVLVLFVLFLVSELGDCVMSFPLEATDKLFRDSLFV